MRIIRNNPQLLSVTKKGKEINIRTRCKTCWREFIAKRLDTRYCSNHCRQQAYRRRRDYPYEIFQDPPDDEHLEWLAIIERIGKKRAERRARQCWAMPTSQKRAELFAAGFTAAEVGAILAQAVKSDGNETPYQ